jgi:hypothetical protein
VPAQLRTGGQLREQPRLADPGLADQLDRARHALAGSVEHLFEHDELRGAAHERVLLAVCDRRLLWPEGR